MWLKFGVAPDGNLTSIDEVLRGKTNLACLYCGGGLAAKKAGLTQLAHGDECDRPNPITVTRPLRLQVDKRSKMLCRFLIEPGGRSSTRATLTYTA